MHPKGIATKCEPKNKSFNQNFVNSPNEGLYGTGSQSDLDSRI